MTNKEQREKLVELLEGAESAMYWDGSSASYIAKIADHLIANGVTILEKGEWKLHGNDGDVSSSYFCNRCGYVIDEDEFLDIWSSMNFCNRCGADMRPEPPKGE